MLFFSTASTICPYGMSHVEVENVMPKIGDALKALVEVSPNAQAEEIVEVATRPDEDSFIMKPSKTDLDEVKSHQFWLLYFP